MTPCGKCENMITQRVTEFDAGECVTVAYSQCPICGHRWGYARALVTVEERPDPPEPVPELDDHRRVRWRNMRKGAT